MNSIFEFSECPIWIDKVMVFANDVKVTANNRLEPQYFNSIPNVNQGVPNNGLTIDVSLNFYPLYQDPIYASITGQQPVNLTIGGMKLKNGRTSQFSLQGNYGSPVLGSARITFYTSFDGAFNPIKFKRDVYHTTENQNFQIAHTSLTEIIQDLKIDVPMNFTYNYNSTFFPVYKIGSELCQDIRMDRRSIQSTIIGESVENYISVFGEDASISIKLKDICGKGLTTRRGFYYDEFWTPSDTSYICNGKITQFDASINQNDIIKGTVQVVQYI